ncbi:MAG TPA: GDP-L-fucose synthase [Pirellulales bacterium]|nr:GDP-L-fucose synthase [Pirellulales bacterium]
MIQWTESRVCVTGGAGFLGRFVCAQLIDRGVSPDQLIIPRRAQYDLTQEEQVKRLYREQRPDIVIHLAAEVGGIGANMSQPGRFFYTNMAMGLHLIEYARQFGIRKFIHTGTVCAYPKFAPVPFREDDLWNGYPEETNAPYGVAKKALFVMLDAYHRQYGLPAAVVVPVNLYGPGDNFDPASSHVIPALIRKCETALQRHDEEIVCWGTGTASREFLYVEDAARGIVQAAQEIEEPTPINLGTGREITIADLVQLIARLCGFRGYIAWDGLKPDGQPRRCLDTSRAAQLLNWTTTMPLEEGLRRTIASWREHPRFNSVSPAEMQVQ